MYSALMSKKLKLEVKEEIDWKVEVKDEVQLGSQIKLEYSEGPRDGLVFKEEGNLDEEAEQEDNVGPHMGQVPGDLDYIKSEWIPKSEIWKVQGAHGDWCAEEEERSGQHVER